jgi:hypothetical protein
MNIGDQDQIQASLTDFAYAVFQYYAKLASSGFSNEQAFQLTLQWQNIMLANNLNK